MVFFYEMMWKFGVLAGNGCIYCIPFDSVRRNILKIDTNSSTVTVLDVEFPEAGKLLGTSGALGLDGCIYCMPLKARFMLKMNPEDDTVSSVGIDFGEDFNKFSGTVAGNDGCLYGIPDQEMDIMKFDPVNQVQAMVAVVGKPNDNIFMCRNGGALGRDSCIYAIEERYGKILKINVVNDTYSFVGNKVQTERGCLWGRPLLGNDGCIYFPPFRASHALRFDPEIQVATLVGGDFGKNGEKWEGGAVASDGVIYCIPSGADHVLSIDPFKDFAIATQASMEQFPEDLGRLFDMNEYWYGKTVYDCAITKFGKDKVHQVIDECIPLNVEFAGNNIPSFMVAGSCRNTSVFVIFHLLRKNLDF